MTSMVFHGDRTTKLRSLRPFEPLPPMTHFKNGKRTPAISRIEVKVFSNMSPATYNSKRQLGHKCQKHAQVISTFSSLNTLESKNSGIKPRKTDTEESNKKVVHRDSTKQNDEDSILKHSLIKIHA